MRAKESVWDSAVFGVDVGILREWDPKWAVADIREANREDFEVVFVKTAGWADPPAGAVAVDHVYDLETSVDVNNPVGTFHLEGAPSAALLAVAETAFPESRFRRDPALAARAGEFYRRWLANAEGRTLVLDDAAADAFLVETKDQDGAGRIDLVAVSKARRGRGLGTRLVHGTITRPAAPPVWRVKTSARNWRALAFYERLGFMVRAAFTAFHIWVDK